MCWIVPCRAKQQGKTSKLCKKPATKLIHRFKFYITDLSYHIHTTKTSEYAESLQIFVSTALGNKSIYSGNF